VGLKVVGGAKPVSLPDVGPDVEIKITNAALEGKGRAELFVHRGEDEKYLACVLDESKGIFQAHLEYVFSPEDPVQVAFSVKGGKDTAVHLTGFGFEQPGDDYSYDEDDESMFDESGSEDDSEDDDESESESEEEGSVIGIREITSDEEKAAKPQQKKKAIEKIDEPKAKQAKPAAAAVPAAAGGDLTCVPCQKPFPNARALEQHNIGKHKDKSQTKSEAKLAEAKPAEAKPEGNGKKAEKQVKQEKTPETPKKPEQKKPQPQTPQPAKVQPKSTPAPKVEEKKVEEKKFDDKKRKASASQGQLAKKPKSN